MDDVPNLHVGDLILRAADYRMFLTGAITWQELLATATVWHPREPADAAPRP